MEEYIKYVVTFLSGGVVGTILNNLISNHKNKIQLMNCEYLRTILSILFFSIY